MSTYESAAIEVARSSLTVATIMAAIAFVGLAVAIVGGWNVLRQLNIARWNSLLSFEQDMAARRTAFTDIAAQLVTPNANAALLQNMFNEAKESYFNSLDRLASSIIRGHFPDREMKEDYQEVFTNVVRAYQSDFGLGTRFRKVMKLYNQWADEK